VERGCGLEAPGYYPDRAWPPSKLCGTCDDLCAGLGGTCDADVTASVSSCAMMEGIFLDPSTIGHFTGYSIADGTWNCPGGMSYDGPMWVNDPTPRFYWWGGYYGHLSGNYGGQQFQVCSTNRNPGHAQLCSCAGVASQSSATGDPHLQNIHGERFDLMSEGKHMLVSIPRGERAENALLSVEAEARKLGGQCDDMYFTEINITGSWAYEKQDGGYHYVSHSVARESGEWISLGMVELKVVNGRTETGTQYLNFFIKHLGRAGLAVGGLLGEDDHEAVSTPPTACVQHLSLGKERPLGRASSASSIAAGTLA